MLALFKEDGGRPLARSHLAVQAVVLLSVRCAADIWTIISWMSVFATPEFWNHSHARFNCFSMWHMALLFSAMWECFAFTQVFHLVFYTLHAHSETDSSLFFSSSSERSIPKNKIRCSQLDPTVWTEFSLIKRLHERKANDVLLRVNWSFEIGRNRNVVVYCGCFSWLRYGPGKLNVFF